MGNHLSTRWGSHTRAVCVEDCRRITPREAQHVGAVTVQFPVAGTSAHRLYCQCSCGARALYLYARPDDPAGAPAGSPAWKCRACHRLTYKRAQMKGTRAAFVEWFTPEQRDRLAKTHPARKALNEWYGREWFAQVAPYNFEHADEARRAELIERYGSAQAARREFERRRDAFMERLHEKEIQTGQRINAAIWKRWKAINRTARPRKSNAVNC